MSKIQPGPSINAARDEDNWNSILSCAKLGPVLRQHDVTEEVINSGGRLGEIVGRSRKPQMTTVVLEANLLGMFRGDNPLTLWITHTSAVGPPSGRGLARPAPEGAGEGARL